MTEGLSLFEMNKQKTKKERKGKKITFVQYFGNFFKRSIMRN